MAKAKRAKVVSLTRTKAKTREHKENLIGSVRDAANEYSYVWVFAISNMRNLYLDEARKLWTGSKMFFGKLRVIAKALGESESEEIRPRLAALSKRLRGNVGLLFTDSPPAEVLDWCSDYQRLDFARMGGKATETVKLEAGPVMIYTEPRETLPHNIEPQLRKLNMPTQLKNGIPTLLQDFTVCKKGEILTAEKAQILKHLLIQMAHFRLIPLVYWSAIGASGEENQKEGVIVDVPLSDSDLELAKNAGALLGTKKSRVQEHGRDEEMVDDDEDDDDDDEPDEINMIEERDSAMMLPEGLQL
ncbi:mRNA turnover and ribosome assembly protein [Malassezia vespertilionis]|uniref:Ribosome assembly factor mrt4 n=1 Tax=Malassezia vespertilionis TaxID=2020962 RepID=A0A2N1JBG1_9BASI|nr:mRNA turnover and ribosome assembly protein [Malassezia vespertilionis]PKI83883.1 Mrt4p [Malassezia vespertilionis]WFD06748.1 mRNA turnover and ribosome assembly protein [Malassezia vespertilionis]